MAVGTAGETKTKSEKTSFYGPLHMDVPVFANQQGFTYIRSM